MSQAEAAAPSAQPSATTPGEPSTEFRPVEGGGNVASGEMLLIQAYAVFWLLAFALVIVTLRKQRKLDDRIDQLERDVAKARGDD